MALRTYGTMAVDWEQRVDLERLRAERLARAKRGLAESELGGLLCFDMRFGALRCRRRAAQFSWLLPRLG